METKAFLRLGSSWRASAQTYEHNKDAERVARGLGTGRYHRKPPGVIPSTWPVQKTPLGKLYLGNWSFSLNPPERRVRWGRRRRDALLWGEQFDGNTFCKRIPNINPNQKKKTTTTKQKPQPKEWQKQTKKNPNQMKLEGGGEEDKCRRRKEGSRRISLTVCLSVCHLALGLQHSPHSETV